MNKQEIESLCYCIKDILESAYFSYTTLYSVEIEQNSSFRMAFGIDTRISPFEADLEKDGRNINVRMLELVIYRTLLGKYLELVVTNTISKNGLPIIIPINESLKIDMFNQRKVWITQKVESYLLEEFYNLKK